MDMCADLLMRLPAARKAEEDAKEAKEKEQKVHTDI
jgi:hypothetical protein